MGIRPSFWRAAAALVLVFTLSMPVLAANDVATISGGGPLIQWDVKAPGAGVELTVMDPEGNGVLKRFTGRNPLIRVSDFGSAPVDGVYNYELRVVPNIPAHVQARLAAARENGDEAEIKRIQKEAKIGPAVVQSGAITLLNGGWVNPNGTEEDANDTGGVVSSGIAGSGVTTDANRPSQPVAQDQVIPDDLIVQGSICTGFDCVDGEAFGADTIRLKENTLRIHFEDTSTAAGYPANDWRIMANDQTSGGASYLSINDATANRNVALFEAAAPLNSLYVDSTGNIGMQTATPGLDLHLNMNDTPAIRLEQNNTGGFTAQTWDVAGNEANFFVRDLTGGSKLPFRIRPGAPTSSLDIAASGNVGLGTASPEKKLDIFGVSTLGSESGIRLRGSTTTTEIADFYMGNTGNLVITTANGGGTQAHIDLRPEDDEFGLVLRESDGTGAFPYANFYVKDATDDFMTLDVNSVTSGDIVLTATGKVGFSAGTTLTHPFTVGTNSTNGNGAHLTAGGVWTIGSSRAFKHDVEELSADAARTALAGLKPVSYTYNNEPEEKYVGFIAEEVPELVAQTSTGRHYLSPMDIVATLTKVVQEQQKTIDELAAKVQELENKKQ